MHTTLLGALYALLVNCYNLPPGAALCYIQATEDQSENWVYDPSSGACWLSDTDGYWDLYITGP